MYFGRQHPLPRQTVIKCKGVFIEYSQTKEPVGKRKARLYESGIIRDKETVLLNNITTIKGEHVRHHAWFFRNQGFDGLTLKKGDQVFFDAIWIETENEEMKLKIVGAPKLEVPAKARKFGVVYTT
jgi:hypothetical protein